MPYTPSPVLSTYSTKRIPAVASVELRPFSTYFYNSGAISQDPGMVNMLTYKSKDEMGKDTLTAYTRPALVGATIDSTYTNRTVRGVYVWEKDSTHTYYFAVLDGKVYTSSNGTSWASVQNITSADTPVSFTEYISSTATKSLILCVGTSNIYQFTSNLVPVTINLGFTAIPFIVYIDGYLFTAKAGTGDIYNSNLDDPTTWAAGSFISSELYPDDVKALVKVNNYLMAIGTQGSEFFYDAANATGTPLARSQELALPFGTILPSTVAYNKNVVVFVANNNDGEVVIKVVENTKTTEIPAGWFMEYLAATVQNTGTGHGSSTTDTLKGCFMRFRGDIYYVLSTSPYLASGYNSSKISNWISSPTFALNLNTGIWTELRINTLGIDIPFTFVYSSPARTGRLTNYVVGLVPNTTATAVPCWATLDEGGTSASTESITTYLTGNINVEMRTAVFDFDTKNSKMMSRFGVLGTTATPNTTASVNIQWSDDNYGTWSTARALDIKDSTDFPFITQLGRFRKRSFRLTYSGTSPIWIESFEVDINKAQQ